MRKHEGWLKRAEVALLLGAAIIVAIVYVVTRSSAERSFGSAADSNG